MPDELLKKAKRTLVNMKQRCFNPKNNAYLRDGGRGITVCDRWLSFDNFLSDMGLPPDLRITIDRINNDGNYEPGNCRWATYKEQAANQTKGGVAARNYLATHCVHGHEFTADNIYITKRGRRHCRECAKRHSREHHLRTYVRSQRVPPPPVGEKE